MDRIWSEQQKAIFNWFANGEGNLVVRARAGTGKTTTILEAINHAPESKQLVCAFNKSIAVELGSKLTCVRAEAKTLHGVGYAFIRKQWPTVTVDKDRGLRLAQAAAPKASRDVHYLIKDIASLAKGCVPSGDAEQMANLAYDFGHLPSEQMSRDGWEMTQLVAAAQRAMVLACKADGTIDFDDQVYVPLANGWVKPTYNLIVVDEAQDMNLAQLEVALKAAKGRIAVVGDDRQAIYGFRGADSKSIDRLKKELSAAELGLTTTYRCAADIVALAQKIVPDYYAAPGAPKGTIRTISSAALVKEAQSGDFVLSRKNAPLAGYCLALLRAGKRARIEGKDVAGQLTRIIYQIKARTIPEFLTGLKGYVEKQSARLKAAHPEEKAGALIANLKDICDTIAALAGDLRSVTELHTRIATLFVKDADQVGNQIVLSTVHKAKGKETNRTFILKSSFRNIDAKDGEEANIAYVAVTRAKSELVWVVDGNEG